MGLQGTTRALVIAGLTMLSVGTTAVVAAAPAHAGWHDLYDDEDDYSVRAERRVIEKTRVVQQPVVERTVVIERPVVRRPVVVHRTVVVEQPIYVREVVRRPVHVRRLAVIERPWHPRRRCFLPETDLCY